MIFCRLSLVSFLAMALPAAAQDTRWDLVDTGIVNHSSHGQGIEMRIKPEPMPDGLFDSDNLDAVMSALCNHYAPSVIPYVQEQTGLDTPDFIAVRLISGGAVFGRYVLQAYLISDGGCGDEL